MKEQTNSFSKLISLLSNEKKEIAFIYLYGFLGGLVGLTLPLGIQAIINLIGGNQISTSWIILVVIVVLGIILQSIMQVMQLYLTENFQQKIFVRSAFEFATRIPKMDFKYLNDRYPPELVNRFFDTLTVQKGIPKILIDFSTSIFQIIFGVILLSVYHPFFILFGMILLIIIFIIFRFSFPLGMKTSIEESKYKYKIAYWLEELARTIETFKLAGKNDYPEVKTDGLLLKYLKARKSHFRILLYQYFNLAVFKVIIATGLLLIGGFLVFQQQMNIGQFVAAEIIILLIINSTEKLILGVETFYDVLTGLEKISEIVDIELENNDGLSVEEDSKSFSIQLSEINFYNYSKNNKILDKINLNINKGEKIVLTGGKLSGKSALIQLISTLYTDYEGSISFNNIPLSNLNKSELRSKIGDNLFKEDIFNATLLENLTFGKKISIEKINEALEVVGLNKFINSLPDGLYTELVSGGFGLKRQENIKIKLARCIIIDPAIILIEDTIDLLEDEDVLRIIDYILKLDSTSIVISSKLAIISKFDRIVAMEDGKKVFDDSVLLFSESSIDKEYIR